MSKTVFSIHKQNNEWLVFTTFKKDKGVEFSLEDVPAETLEAAKKLLELELKSRDKG